MFWESCRLSDVILRFIFLALKCFSSMLRELPEASDVLCFLFVFGIKINFSILKELPEAVDGAVVPSYNLSSHWAGWVIACFSINFHPCHFCNFYHLFTFLQSFFTPRMSNFHYFHNFVHCRPAAFHNWRQLLLLVQGGSNNHWAGTSRLGTTSFLIG